MTHPTISSPPPAGCCRCVMLEPARYPPAHNAGPAEWEQADNCPVHPRVMTDTRAEWAHDHLEEMRSAKFEALAGTDGLDQIAHREVLRRVKEELGSPDTNGCRSIVDANLIAVEVLAGYVEAARDDWDPAVLVGSAALGVVRALKDLGHAPAVEPGNVLRVVS